MRPLIARLVARLVVTSALALVCGVGCANRGMVAPSDETGSGGSSPAGGKGGGSGGGGGKGGGGGSNVDASCSVVTDALFDHSTTTCSAMFNFEGSGNLEGATKLAGSQAFTAVSQGTTPNTYCGTGSLAIAATFSGTSGPLEKGEVDIPLAVDAGAVDLTGKTLTVHVMASPAACGEDLRFSVILKTATGSPTALTISALTSNFTTASKSLATIAGASATNAIAIEAFSTTNYTGTIYVDEIDLK